MMDPSEERLRAQTLNFDPKTHTYAIGGRELISVTTILEEAGLYVLPHVTEEMLNWAQDRGTKIHEACRFLDERDLDWDSLDPMISGYVLAYQEFKKDTGFTPKLSEHKVHDTVFGIAGRLDRFGFIQDRGVMADIKTGAVPRSTGLQLVAYGYMHDPNKIFYRMAVQLKINGTYKVTDYPISDYQRDLDTFLSAVRIVNWKRRNQNGH